MREISFPLCCPNIVILSVMNHLNSLKTSATHFLSSKYFRPMITKDDNGVEYLRRKTMFGLHEDENASGMESAFLEALESTWRKEIVKYVAWRNSTDRLI